MRPGINLIFNGASRSLHAAIGDRPTLIMFYRGDWCGNCINHFNAEVIPNLQRINALGYNVMFIGPDSPEYMRATASKINASPSIIWSDAAGDLSVAMGVAWQQGERMLERLAEHSGGKNKGFVPVITTFVVGSDKK
ncbi:MAG: redoxin domain-containing protein, partial [Tannerella sp.]|nr:redoxin domain-containing protein [Tannerella sp.]